MAAYDSLMVFTGTANPELAQNVVKHLDISLGRADVANKLLSLMRKGFGGHTTQKSGS